MSCGDLDSFFGRETVLDLLKKRVLDLKDGYRQNLAFLGDRYVGKSTILHKFVADLDDPDIIPIFVDLENMDLPGLCRRYIGSMLYHFARVKGLPLHDDINLLLESSLQQLPETVKAIKKIQNFLQLDKDLEAYKEILVLPQLFAAEANKFCLLIVDEFDLLEEFGLEDAYQELGKRIMTQKRCLYVVTSSMVAAAQKILAEKLSLLFGNFEVVQMEAFDFKASEGFVRARLGNCKIGPTLLNFLVDFTGGSPLYLRLVTDQLVALTAIHQQEEIFIPLLIQAVEDVLFHPWGVIGRHFEGLMRTVSSGRGMQAVDDILTQLSHGKQKAKDLARVVGEKERLLTLRLNRLVEKGIVFKNGNFYFLKDKLLRCWLKYVFQKRRYAIDYDLAKQKCDFQAEMQAMVNDFLSCSQKGLSARIIDLFHCFEDEAFQINNRRYKLPLFHKIAACEQIFSREGYDMITAMADDGPWVIILSYQKVGENDIGGLLQEARKLEPKPQRCILISLDALDENTRVRALQERMWIWNEGELAVLLNLYNKPFIVDGEKTDSVVASLSLAESGTRLPARDLLAS